MKTFKQFNPVYISRKVQEEISYYGYEFDTMLREMSDETRTALANLPTTDQLPAHIKALHKVPNPVTQRHGNVWQHVRKGAQEYFHGNEGEQEMARREAETVNKNKLFTNEASNPKLAKNGEKVPSFDTKGLFLAPSTMSGIDVCPNATKECAAACLGKESGRAAMRPVRQARINRTHMLFNNPKHFYAKLDNEITAAKKAAAKRGQKLAVRLNGTSDIPHEHIAPELFKKHHDVQFYDYTKIAGRPKHKSMPNNYHLTVSSTGLNHSGSNWKQVREHLNKGGVASMVFKVQTGIKGRREAGKLPTHVHDEETGRTYKVIDGDEHDHRHLDHTITNTPNHEGVIAGLRMKGGPKNIERAGNFAVTVDKEHNMATAKRGQN